MGYRESRLIMKKIITLYTIILLMFLMAFGCSKKANSSETEELPKKPGVLSGFESTKVWDISPETGFKLELSNENVTEGAHSMKVEYPIDDYPGINIKKFYLHNWEPYENFAIDIYNPSNENIIFTARIDDLRKKRANMEYCLRPGMNKVRMPVCQIASNIDIKNVSYIVLFLNYPGKRYTLFFDNMRLMKPGETDEGEIKEERFTVENPSEINYVYKIWAIDDCVKIWPYEKPQAENYVWDGGSSTVKLFSAKNEYIGFQLIIKSGLNDLTVNRVFASNLTGPGVIGKQNISLMKVHYLNVTEPSTSMYGPVTLGKGEYPDPLIPLEAPRFVMPITINKGRNQPIWVDIYVPPETLSGHYNGIFEVEFSDIGKVSVNLELDVWDFTLPDQTHLKTFFYYGPEQIFWAHHISLSDIFSYMQLEMQYQRETHKHRMNMATDVGCYGNWAAYLDRAGLYLSGKAFKDGAGKGVGSCLWPVGEAFDLINETNFKEACRWYVETFAKEGWQDKLFLYIVDEPGDLESYDLVRKLGSWVHEAPSPGNKLPFMVTESPVPQRAEFGSLVGFVDIWCSGDFYGPMQERQKAGERIWTYNGGPDSAAQLIDTHGLACRSWAWTAWRYNIECWFLWDLTYWVDKHNLRNQPLVMTDLWVNPLTFDQRRKNPRPRWPDWGNGDGTFLYPGYDFGIDGPITSFRMKAFRRGMQDYEYLYLLSSFGKREIADKFAEELNYSKNKDPEKWYAVRFELAKEILKAIKEKENKDGLK